MFILKWFSGGLFTNWNLFVVGIIYVVNNAIGFKSFLNRTYWGVLAEKLCSSCCNRFRWSKMPLKWWAPIIKNNYDSERLKSEKAGKKHFFSHKKILESKLNHHLWILWYLSDLLSPLATTLDNLIKTLLKFSDELTLPDIDYCFSLS